MRDRLHRLALRAFGLLPRRARSRLVRTFYPTFTAGAVVAITDGEGHVLLVSQSYTRGWSMPGGLMGRNEEPADTARRELREELGLEVSIDSHPLALRTPWRRHYNFVFRAEVDRLDPATMKGHSPEITDVAWFSVDALPDLTEFTDHFLAAVGLIPEPPVDD